MNRTILAAALVLLLFGGVAFALPGHWHPMQHPIPAHSEEWRENVSQAIEDGDYDEWKNLMEEGNGNPHVLEVVNEDNFDEFAELHEYMEKAREIAKEIGLKFGFRI